MKRAAFLIILSSLLLVRSSGAVPPTQDDTKGNYRVVFKGIYNGIGKAIVTPKALMIRASLVDENGNDVDFTVQKITVENNRFAEDVSVAGRTINIAGRIDPSGGALKKARITFTYGAPEVGFGRATGEHN